MKRFVIAISVFVFATGPTNLSYQAKIYRPDNSALEAANKEAEPIDKLSKLRFMPEVISAKG